MKNKCRYQILLQQRHLAVIAGALKFRHRLCTGDVSATFGKVAMESWHELPDVETDAYPARVGTEAEVQGVVRDACAAIVRNVWCDKPPMVPFELSLAGELVARLSAQWKGGVRHTRCAVKVTESEMVRILHAVEFELRIRIGHFALFDSEVCGMLCDRFNDEETRRERRHAVQHHMEVVKGVAWEFEGNGNYGPWFSYKSRFLYDIYSVIQHELGHWRYDRVHPLVPGVPLLEIKRLW